MISNKPENRSFFAYALMTAAYNEEAYIEATIRSVLSQTYRPALWIVVSDGSCDRTDEIARTYASRHDFIRLLRLERMPGRSFQSKAVALQNANRLWQQTCCTFVGNLDADITLEPEYFEKLITNLAADRSLGIASGFVWDKINGSFQSRPANRIYSVPHGAQLMRRECYEAIGGYIALKYGGEDWHAQTAARMKGWRAVAFPELKIFHHRPTGTADNILVRNFCDGRSDFALGSDPAFELFKCIQRLPYTPFLIGGLCRLLGFLWSCLSRERRPVSPEFLTFLRQEQRGKMKAIFRRAISA